MSTMREKKVVSYERAFVGGPLDGQRKVCDLSGKYLHFTYPEPPKPKEVYADVMDDPRPRSVQMLSSAIPLGRCDYYFRRIASDHKRSVCYMHWHGIDPAEADKIALERDKQ